MYKFVFVSLIFLSACMHRQIVTDRGPAELLSSVTTPISISSALQPDFQKVEEILRSRSVPLDRDMVTFNYQSDPSFTPRSLEDVQHRMSSGWAEKYFDLDDISVDQGPGQYAATDPFSSRWYGREHPQLYVITLAQGSMILDVTKNYQKNERAVLEEIYQRLNCGKQADNLMSPPPSDLRTPFDFDDMIGRMRTSSVADCRRLIIRAVQDLNVQAILYNLEGISTLTGCRHSRQPAIDIIRHDAIRMNDLAYYDDQLKIEGKPMSGYVASLYRESMVDPDVRTSFILDHYPVQILGSLKNATVAAPLYSAWKSNEIFRCGPTWFSENQDDLSEAMETLDDTYQDHSVLDDLVQMIDAYYKRFLKPSRMGRGQSDFDLSRLNQIERLEYEADPIRDDLSFDSWKQAADDTTGSDSKGIAKASLILDGKPIVQSKGDFDAPHALVEAIRRLARDGDPRSDIPEMFFQSNYGPRLARISSNSWIISIHGVPFLKGPLPSTNDTKQQIDKLVQTNKKIFLNVIEACTAQYLNPKISNDEIRAGPCGVRAAPPSI